VKFHFSRLGLFGVMRVDDTHTPLLIITLTIRHLNLYLCIAGAQQADVSRTEGDGIETAAANRQPAPAAGHQGAAPALPQVAGGAQRSGQRGGRAAPPAAGAGGGPGVQAAPPASAAGSSGPAEDLQCHPE